VRAANPVTLDVRLDAAGSREALERDAKAGLSSTPKTLPPVWFYDDVGSELFDRITRLPEYYQTRAERALLELHAHEIATASKATTLIEFGAGTCTKTRVLLDAFAETGTLRHYVAVDVAESTLVSATDAIAHEYPELLVTARIADFLHFDGLVEDDSPTLIAFLGGTIGNLEPADRRRFYTNLDAVLESSDSLLLGADLVKDRARLVAAYNDREGVTAAFNRNVLSVLNRELGADFDESAFEHVAVYDEEHSWIEMRLRSTRAQQVTVRELGLTLTFARGEDLRTEVSAKFTPEGLTRELDAGGFVLDQLFGADGDFLLALSHPYC
jgi:L-histidine Nalpha-methyltransferase